MNRWIGAVLALVCAHLAMAAAQPADTTALDGYLAGLKTWSAGFTQSAVDAAGKPLAGSTGRLVIVRPGKFRWETAPDGAGEAAQVLIADGRNLWFVDRDMDEATVKPLSEVMRQSPLMLLVGATDLRGAFEVVADGRRDGFDWVRVLPRDAASDFREAQFGFRNHELARLVIADKLGQRSTLAFRNVKRNAPVEPGLTEFVPPEGMDLIGKPVAP